MDFLDQILAAEMAKEYTDSQRLGYIKTKNKTITFDGVADGKLQADFGFGNVIKISDETIDFSIYEEARITLKASGVEMTYNCITDSETLDGVPFSYVVSNDEVRAISASGNVYDEDGVTVFIQRGTYIRHEDNAYISEIKLSSTQIEQIDPKFIPSDHCFINLSDIFPEADASELILGALQAGEPTYAQQNSTAFFDTIKDLPRDTAVFLNVGITSCDMCIPCSLIRTDDELWQIAASATVAMESASTSTTVMTIRFIITDSTLYCAVTQDFSATS